MQTSAAENRLVVDDVMCVVKVVEVVKCSLPGRVSVTLHIQHHNYTKTTPVLCSSLLFVRSVEICTEDRRFLPGEAWRLGCIGLFASCNDCLHQVINVFYNATKAKLL